MGGHEVASPVDDRGYLVRQPEERSSWESALCVCPGERKDLQVLGMGINGCRSARNVELKARRPPATRMHPGQG